LFTRTQASLCISTGSITV